MLIPYLNWNLHWIAKAQWIIEYFTNIVNQFNQFIQFISIFFTIRFFWLVCIPFAGTGVEHTWEEQRNTLYNSSRGCWFFLIAHQYSLSTTKYEIFISYFHHRMRCIFFPQKYTEWQNSNKWCAVKIKCDIILKIQLFLCLYVFLSRVKETKLLGPKTKQNSTQ